MKNIHTLLLLVLFSQTFSVLAQNGTQKILVTDLTRIKQVVSVTASPDGNKALYTLRTIEPNAENKLEYDYRNHLYLIDLQANAPPPRFDPGT